MNNTEDTIHLQSVYILSTPVPDRNPQGFAFKDQQSLFGQLDIYRDFWNPVGNDRNWQSRRLAEKWTLREVIGYVRPENDFPMVVEVPAFSQRAVDALGDFLSPNGELLPLISSPDLGKYYAYNTTTIADILDLDRSEIERFSNNSHIAMTIPHHEFHPDRLDSLSIFRITDSSSKVYVTNRFVERVRTSNLNGFLFMKVWPLPKGTNWYKIAQNEYEQQSQSRVKRAKKRAQKKSDNPGNWVASPPKGEALEAINEAIASYEENLAFEVSKLPSDQKQVWIQQSLEQLQASSETKAFKLDRSFWLAIAWGQATVKELGWNWISLADGLGTVKVVVASPDRAYVVPALDYFERIALRKDAEVTSNLLYNMIKAGKMSPSTPGSLFVLG